MKRERIVAAALLAPLPLLAVAVGKLWDWQALLVGLWTGILLMLWGWARAAKPSAEPAETERPKRKQRRREAPAEQSDPPRQAIVDIVDLGLALFLLLQIITLFPSVYRYASILYVMKVTGCALVFWLCRYCLGEKNRLKYGPWLLVAGGVVAALWGLREYVHTAYLLGQSHWRIFGPMYNPNVLAGYLLPVVFVALALLFGSQTRKPSDEQPPRRRGSETDTDEATRWPEIAAFFTLLLTVGALLLTGSKAAFGCAFLGGMAMAVWGLRRYLGGRVARVGILVGGLAVIAVALLAPPLRVRLAEAFGTQGHSAIFRVYTWQATVEMIKARPLTGFGGGTFEHAFPRYAIAGFTRSAHQTFLQVGAESGLGGLIVLLASGVVLLVALARRAATDANRIGGLLASAALASLIASSLHQMVDYTWYVPAVCLSLAALSGMALGPGAQWRSFTVPLQPLAGRWPSYGTLATGAILVFASSIWLYAEIVAVSAENRAREGNLTVASRLYERASRLSPLQARYHVRQANVEEALALRGHYEAVGRAIRARLAAIQRQPTEPQHYLALSRLYELAEDEQSALRAALEAVNTYPTYPRGLVRVGEMYGVLGQHDEAIAAFRRLDAVYESPVGRYPPVESMVETAYVHGWLVLGKEAEDRGETAQALEYYCKAAHLMAHALQMDIHGLTGQLVLLGEVSEAVLAENRELAREVVSRFAGIDNIKAKECLQSLQALLDESKDDQSSIP